eukprot:XP_017944937.1 PREDICTED: UDP-N-acetylglucosamine/UDP-glucose/GDP-mannose transporter isoform X2 [Xenopus tropicalis]
MAPNTEPPHTHNVLILSALFYAASSLLIILVNKTVLTIYRFPSSTFLGVGQMAITILILYVGKLYQIISFPDFDRQVPKKLFPLPLLYIGNHLTGLSSTQKLSLPMFTVLRKFSIPLTLILEMIILRKRFPFSVVSSVTTIIMGALIAASFDLSFNLEGYILVLLNDLFTASYGVYTKEKIDPKELGKYGVLFYNASFMILPTLIYTILSGDFELIYPAILNSTMQLLSLRSYNHSHWLPQVWQEEWPILSLLYLEIRRQWTMESLNFRQKNIQFTHGMNSRIILLMLQIQD